MDQLPSLLSIHRNLVEITSRFEREIFPDTYAALTPLSNIHWRLHKLLANPIHLGHYLMPTSCIEAVTSSGVLYRHEG